MPKTKKKSNIYFTSDTQDAIIKYVASTDQVERNLLYRNHIEYAFNKLAEILINKGRFYYAGTDVEEIKSNILLLMLEKLNNYTPEKGKAYSYFTVVVWRYLINKNDTNYKKYKTSIAHDISECENLSNNFVISEDSVYNDGQFIDKLVEYLDYNIGLLFPKKMEFAIADAILEIIRRRERLENFQKKAIYIYIREITNCKSSQITTVVNNMKYIYNMALNDYNNSGYIPKNKLYKSSGILI